MTFEGITLPNCVFIWLLLALPAAACCSERDAVISFWIMLPAALIYGPAGGFRLAESSPLVAAVAPKAEPAAVAAAPASAAMSLDFNSSLPDPTHNPTIGECLLRPLLLYLLLVMLAGACHAQRGLENVFPSAV